MEGVDMGNYQHIYSMMGDNMKNKYYVYLHKYKYGPKAGQVFYVGKGEAYRAWSKNRGALWISCAVEAGLDVEIYKDNMPEDCAYTLEKILVAKYRSIGQAEANITNGGSGAHGMKMTDDAKEAIARTKRKQIYSSLGEEFKSLDDAIVYLRGIGYTASSSSAISSCISGRINYAYDRVWSLEGFPEHTPMRPTIYCSNGMEFESQTRAVKWLRENGWPKANTQKIGGAINGPALSSYGFAWSENKMPEQPKYVGADARNKSRSKVVYCSNGMEFFGVADAVRWLKESGVSNARSSGISASISGFAHTAFGYKWSYEKAPS